MMPRYNMDTEGTHHVYGRDKDFRDDTLPIFEVYGYHKLQNLYKIILSQPLKTFLSKQKQILHKLECPEH